MSDTNSQWDLSVLYDSDTDPKIEKDLASCRNAYDAFAKRWRDENNVLNQPQQLLEALSDWEKLSAEYGYDGKPGYYFRLRSSQEVTNPTIRAKLNLTTAEAKRNADTTRFFILRIGGATPAQQQAVLKDQSLSHFHQFLRRIFDQAKHFLAEGEEKVFSYLIDPAYTKWAEMIEGFLSSEEREVIDESGQTVRVGYGDIDRLLTSNNARTRRSATDAVNNILRRHVEAAENELNAIMETKKASDLLRGYHSPEDERLNDDMIDGDVVSAMVEAVKSRFDIPHRFYRLKASLLGLPKLSYGERNVSYGELTARYPFKDSVNIVERSLEKLDVDFARIFRGFVQNGQIDVFPRAGKRSGAFCAYDRIDLPTYILLNHTDTLRDLTTLAHEVGHGINDELIKQHQTALYATTPLSTAEVASTYMEDFALAEAVERMENDIRLNVLIAKLNDDIATIFRQVAAYSFEGELHRQYRDRGYLSHGEIGDLFQKHMTAYLGESVEFDEGARNWWVGWHHFRRPFYVYSYASGLLISKSLQAKTRKDPSFIAAVKTFLSEGTSRRPKEIFGSLGIDITDQSFWLLGIAQVESTLNEAEALSSLR